MPKNILSKLWAELCYYFSEIYERSDKHHIFLLSGGLAFSLFVCAVPFALIFLVMLGNLFAKPEVAAEIYALIDRLVPYPNQAGPIKELLADRLDQVSSVTEVSGILGILGVFGLLFAAAGLFSSLRTILNTVFETEKTESALIGKLWDFALVIIVLVVTVILMVAIPALDAGLELIQKVSWLEQFTFSGLDQAILNLISLLSLIIVFSGIYWMVPVRKPDWRSALVGALASSLLWLAAKELFGFYIRHGATLKNIYGVYAFVVIFAFWIYYSALILIIGAEIGQLYTNRRLTRVGSDNPQSE